MLESEVVLFHLGKNSADVQMDVSRSRDDERGGHVEVRVNKAIVLDFKRLFQIIKS